jgi:hypothetical protein
MKSLRFTVLDIGCHIPSANAQLVSCPAYVTLSAAIVVSPSGPGMKALPLSDPYVLVSRFGDELSRYIPEAPSPALARKGVMDLFALPINPDVVVFRCVYGSEVLGVTVSLNVPKTAQYCWVKVKGETDSEAKGIRVQVGPDLDARCDATLAVP